MPTLLLIRHGENEYLKKHKLPGQLPDIHLNERGRAQAAALAEGLKKLPIKAIYSSPLERAVETIEPLARELKLEIQLRPALMDIDVGTWTGRSIKVLSRTKAWTVVQRSPSQFHFPNGESFLQTQERVVSTLDAIVAGHKKEMVAVVFHADPIKLAVAHYLGLPLDNFQRLAIQAGSVTVLGVHEMGAALLALNLVPPFSFPLK
jgi:probable phosphomutase (TIGR03848 family)